MEQVQKSDAWVNAITNLGVKGKDKKLGSEATWTRKTREDLEAIYSADEIARKIVDDPVEDAFREGWEYEKISKEQGVAIDNKFQEMDLLNKFYESWVNARMLGGAGLLILTKGSADFDEPMGQEEVEGFTVLNRFELWPEATDIDSNLRSKTFGQPLYYRMQATRGTSANINIRIHRSRLVIFDGLYLPVYTRIRNNYWGDSILNVLEDAIRNYVTAHDAAASLIQDFNVGVWKMKNLAELIAAGKENQLMARIELAAYGKSVIRNIILDTNEEFQEQSKTLTGLPEVMDKLAGRLVAGTNMPHTKLLGESPNGSNSTGNSTTLNYYDSIASQQVKYLKPKLIQVIKLLFPEIKEIEIKFNPLWQLDEKEEAEVKKITADTDQIYIQNEVLTPDEVAQSRFGGEKYSTKTEVDKTLRKPLERPIGE